MTSIDVTAAWGSRLQVRFERTADRYRHVVSWQAAADGDASGSAPAMIDVLRSEEGSAAEAWPPSPPLQSLSIETLPDGRRVAFLVGMAGRGHWSASIEPDLARQALIFDFACRSAVLPERLGSHYAIAEQKVGAGHWQLVSDAEGSAAPKITQSSDSIAVECLLAAAKGPTWRWRYRLELLPPGNG